MTQGGGVITEGEDLSLPGSWPRRMAEGVQGSPTCFDGAKSRPPAPRAQEAGLHLGSQRCYNRFGGHSGSSAKHQHSHYIRGDVKNVVFALSLALGWRLSELQQAWPGPAFAPAAFSGCQPLTLPAQGWRGSLRQAGPLLSTVPGERERAVPPSGWRLSPCLLRALL